MEIKTYLQCSMSSGSILFNEASLTGETWGQLELFVHGIDVCRFKRGDRVTAFEWLSENLKYILRDEPFPLPVK